jgi:hypothetical protein
LKTFFNFNSIKKPSVPNTVFQEFLLKCLNQHNNQHLKKVPDADLLLIIFSVQDLKNEGAAVVAMGFSGGRS